MAVRTSTKDGRLYYNVSDLLGKIDGSDWNVEGKDWIDKSDVMKLVVLGTGDECLKVLVELGITEQLAESEFPDIGWVLLLVVNINGVIKLKSELYENSMLKEFPYPRDIIKMKKKLSHRLLIPNDKVDELKKLLGNGKQ